MDVAETGSMSSSYQDCQSSEVGSPEQDTITINELIGVGKASPVIDESFPLCELPEAL